MKSKKITSKNMADKNIFNKLSNEWWNEQGSFEALHHFNPVRLKFILDSLSRSIKNLTVLDIGCGGGILSEPLSRLGADVTAIDENEQAIKIARSHAKKMNLNIKYINGNLSKDFTKKKFDVITCMEVLEHVDDVSITIEKISKLLKKDGLFVGSTINQTIISYITAIFFAENIFKIVPKRTHSWSQFIKPNKLKKHLFEGNFKDIKFQGVFYNLISKKWKLIENQSINYMFSCKAK